MSQEGDQRREPGAPPPAGPAPDDVGAVTPAAPAGDTPAGDAPADHAPREEAPASPPTESPKPGKPPKPGKSGKRPKRRVPDITGDLDDADTAELIRNLHDRVVTKSQAEMNGLFEILGSKRRLFAVNFFAGLSRGAGFFLGATLIGGLLIGGLAMFIDTTAKAMGFEDVTFRSLIAVFAEKAVEAEKVWDDIRAREPKAEIEMVAGDPDATAEEAPTATYGPDGEVVEPAASEAITEPPDDAPTGAAGGDDDATGGDDGG